MTNKRIINKTEASHEVISNWLIGEKDDLVARNILPSERRVIDLMLRRGVELKAVFNDLHDRLTPIHWQGYLRAFVNATAFWNPEEIKKMRDAERRLKEINAQLARQCSEVEALLTERRELSNEHAFDADDAGHLVDLVDRSSQQNGHYQSFLKPKLEQLRGQYDLKYWPSASAIVREIGLDASAAKVSPMMEITEKAISSRKSSKRDSIRALTVAIEERTGSTWLDIPTDFSITNEGIASLVNCCLDLTDEELVDAQYIKNVHQAMREQED